MQIRVTLISRETYASGRVWGAAHRQSSEYCGLASCTGFEEAG